MRKQFLKFSLILVIVVGAIVQSCKKNDDDAIIAETAQFDEIKDIATFQGDTKSDIVIVNTQGGPVTELEDDFIAEIRNETGTESGVLYVNVHQAQTLNPSLFNQTDITFDQAKEYDAESIANLKKVVSFFKEQPNKKVYVLGISFGAFMTQELIAEHGIDVADGYLIMVGRLNIDEDTWVPFSQGKYTEYRYDSNGDATIMQLEDTGSIEDKNMARLAAGLGFNRYTERLSSISDLSKITYVYGDRDEQVGALTQEEIQFLATRGASVNLAQDANHSDAIDSGLAQLLKTTFNIQ